MAGAKKIRSIATAILSFFVVVQNFYIGYYSFYNGLIVLLLEHNILLGKTFMLDHTELDIKS
jgi:hypothetical protein